MTERLTWLNRSVFWMGAAALVVLLACVLIFWPAPVATPAPPAPVLATVPQVEIAPPSVKVYAPQAKAKMALPKRVQADPAQHVVAAAQVAGDDRARTLITTLDEDSGAFSTYEQVEPVPWLARSTRGAVGVGTGFKGGRHVSWVEARQDLLRSKQLFMMGTGYLDTDQEHRVGLVLEWRW